MSTRNQGKSGTGRRRKGRRSGKKPRRRRAKGRSAASRWRLLGIAAIAFAALAWFVLGASAAGRRAVAALESNPEGVPVEVVAAAPVLRPGEPLDADDLQANLARLAYREKESAGEPGSYARDGGRFQIHRRPHLGEHGAVSAARVRLRIRGGELVDLRDAEGQRLAVFTGEPVPIGAYHGPTLQARRPVRFDEMPQQLVDAVIAAEDARFSKHSGVDLRAILRAAWADVRGRGILQGGSTITQQVIKNRVVGHERTLFRKAREALLALYVEGRVPKERILEIYLNEIYLGQRGAVSILGMPAASLHYFGKDVRDLTLAEAATMAGIIASPGRFDPRRYPERATARRNWVLERLAVLGLIDESEREATSSLPLVTIPPSGEAAVTGDVVDAVSAELDRRGWKPVPGVRAARVFTTIDPVIQRAATRALEETLEELEAQRPARAPLEGAVVVLRPANGEILALVGGRSGARGGFHRAIEARRQPGSAFKPFVALAAFETGEWSPARMLDDEPLEVSTNQGPWEPQNIDGKFRGPVSLREALERSLNVPFARLGLDIEPKTIVRVARRVGVEGRLPRIPSLALGTGEVTPIALATGYATIANLGMRREPFVVRAVRFEGDEDPISLTPPPPPDRAVDVASAFMVLDMMAGVTRRGTGRGLLSAVRGRHVATKTGTTQEGRDAWFVMISGDAVVVAWVGRDDSLPAELMGSSAALPVVRRLLASAGDRLLGRLPQPPESVVIARIDPETGGVASWRCPRSVDEIFPRGGVPERCEAHGGLWERFFRRRDTARGGPGKRDP